MDLRPRMAARKTVDVELGRWRSSRRPGLVLALFLPGLVLAYEFLWFVVSFLDSSAAKRRIGE
jgi:hypothetical protein